MTNQNTIVQHEDALGNELHIGDRVLYRRRINSRTQLGIIQSFTTTAMRVVPEDWQSYTTGKGVYSSTDLPTTTVPKHLGVSVDALYKEQKMFDRWDKFKTPIQLIQQSI